MAFFYSSSFIKPLLLGFVLINFFYLSPASYAQKTSLADSLKYEALYQKLYKVMYTDKQTSYIYIKEIISHSKEINDTYALIAGYISKIRVASFHNDFSSLQKTFTELDVILNSNIEKIIEIEDKDVITNSIKFDKGAYYYKLNNYPKALKKFKEIINYYEPIIDNKTKQEEIDLISTSNNYIAKIYSNDGKLDLAKQYYFNNLRLLEKYNPDDAKRMSMMNSLIGEVYQREKNPETSNGYYLKSWKHAFKNKEINPLTTETHSIVENYLMLSKLDSATYYLDLLKPYITETNKYAHLYYASKAKINLAKNNTKTAIENYEKALMLIKKKWSGKKHYEIAEGYLEMASALKNAKNNVEALMYIEKAVAQVSGKGIVNSSINKITLLKILKLKSALLSEKDPENALKTTSRAIAILDSLKPDFTSQSDKLLLTENAFPVFESGIESAFKMYKKTNDENFAIKAFLYAEKSKNILLFEALLSAKATTFGTIPESLLAEENQLKTEITMLEKEMIKTKEKDDNTRKNLLFKLKQRHRNLLKSIETDYKSYYNLKYNTQVISAAMVQKMLDSETALLSYFYGNKAIYCIAISDQKVTFHKIPTSENFSKKIISCYKDLSNPKSDIHNLAKKSFEIYAAILQKELKLFPKKDKLIIIPDGLLNYIPFGQLNISEKNIHYLIEDKTVSYVNSATLLMQLRENKKVNQKFLGFAPSFNNSLSTLLPLPNNKKEVEAIKNYFDGKTLVGNQATLANFTSQSAHAGILHFASHAVLNDSIPEFSYLAFEPENNSENLLYVSDLYNLNLNTSLVTLSACETGIGNLKRGEGFMSLARGFYFSGASSIASSLWKINDASSATLMENFYKHLSEGDQKDNALQKAKLNFIKENKTNALSHPYYWSGFVISGNMEPIVETSNFWLIGGVAGVLLIGGFLLFRRKKS